MADDRPLEEPPEQVGRLEQDLADLRAMVNARLARRPTGDMEISFRPTPKDNTLVCNGQAVSRTAYADLFGWATDQGLLGSLFGNGDGSTTFTVPDLRDRFPVGAGGSLPLGTAGGAASRTLTSTELPAHAHTATATVTAHAAHDHTVSGSGSATGSAGGHTASPRAPSGITAGTPRARRTSPRAVRV
jgi:microcystin-dependent protein